MVIVGGVLVMVVLELMVVMFKVGFMVFDG